MPSPMANTSYIPDIGKPRRPQIVEQVVDLLGQFVLDTSALQTTLDGAEQIAQDYWASAGGE